LKGVREELGRAWEEREASLKEKHWIEVQVKAKETEVEEQKKTV
jgi:hypothetical protein